MPTEVVGFYDWLLKGGLIAALLTVLALLKNGALLWRAEYTRMEDAYKARLEDKDERIVALNEERNRLFEMVINGQQVASKSLDIAAKREK